MRFRNPIVCFVFVLATTLVFGRPSTAGAQVQIIPGESSPQSSNGLPIGVPEATEGIHGEQQLRYDSQLPWMHGYWQEMPAYGGFGAYRPYNYKHIFSQSQAAGGWGLSPTMPYSQQFWHRYRQRASMRPESHGTPYRVTPGTQSTRYPVEYGRPTQYPPVSSRQYLPPVSSGPRFGYPR